MNEKTQKKIAGKLGICPQHFNDILAGKKNPSPPVARNLARIVGGGIHVWLFGDSADRRDAFESFQEK